MSISEPAFECPLKGFVVRESPIPLERGACPHQNGQDGLSRDNDQVSVHQRLGVLEKALLEELNGESDQ